MSSNTDESAPSTSPNSPGRRRGSARQTSAPPSLWFRKGITIGTVVGGPLGAGVLFGLNYWRLRRPLAGIGSIFAGFLATVGLFFAVAYMGPYSIAPGLAIVIGAFLFSTHQQTVVETRLGEEITPASSWKAALVGLVCTLSVSAVLASMLYWFAREFARAL